MSRIERLQQRLDDLKVEFRTRLSTETQKVAAGRHSRYLSRKKGHFYGRYYEAPESDILEKLEAEIRTLAGKLSDSEAMTLLRSVEQYEKPTPDRLVLPNDDRIAKAARGRFFPVSVSEVEGFIQELGFSPPLYRRRLDITFRNTDCRSEDVAAAAFYPASAMVLYSFPKEFDRLRAKNTVETALHEFAALGRDATPARHPRVVDFRAYLKALNQLVITKRTRRVTSAKYRGDMKFSHAFKPKGIKTDEQVVHMIDLT